MNKTARLLLGASAFGVALLFAGCDQDEGPRFEEQTLEFKTTLPGTALEVVDNGYLTDPYLYYCEYSPEGWYFIETPSRMGVSPRRRTILLEPYFPEGGSSCALTFYYGEDALVGYSVEFSGDTVRVLAEINTT